ncbi:hypothetical protein QEL91_004121 [Pseudomonas putida]|nr:hypothetical protein [Pseudomonas putida]
MANLVTDQRPGEPDSLSVAKLAASEIRSIAGVALKAIAALATGWTHQQLMAVALGHEPIPHDGVDGYPGSECLSSNEI